jgi:hypothetical protein
MQLIMLENYGFNGSINGIYHTQICLFLEDKDLNLSVFIESIRIAFKIFPNLRTYFNLAENKQAINQDLSLKPSLVVIDLTNLVDSQKLYIQHFMEKDRENHFDISKCLCRYFVFKLSNTDFAFLSCLHHSIADGWGTVEYLKTLFNLYDDLKSGICSGPNFEERPNIHRRLVDFEQKIAENPIYIEFWNKYIKDTFCESIHKNSHFSSEEKNIRLEKYIENFSFSVVHSKVGSHPKAFFLAAYIRTIDEIIFKNRNSNYFIGVVSNGGRNIDIVDSLTAYGLFWNMMPLKRVYSEDPKEHIKLVNEGLINIEPYLSYPLKRILFGKDNEKFMQFSFNFTKFHHLEELNQSSSIKMKDSLSSDIMHYPLNLAVDWDTTINKLSIVFNYDRKFLSNESALEIFQCYCSTVEMFFKYFNEII